MFHFDVRRINSGFGATLRVKLTEVGYIDVMQSISDTVYPQEIISRLCDSLDTELKEILRLFCLAEAVPRAKIPSEWTSILETLRSCGVMRSVSNCYTMAPLCIYVVGDLLYIAECPNPLFSVYFGEDSYALLTRKRLLLPDHARVLDLCSGAGIQGISFGSQAREIDLVEINAIAGKLAEINAAINFPNTQINVHVTDVMTFLESAHSEYDLILCNPPLVPIPDGFAFNRVSHGGWDGLRFVRPIIRKIDHLLAPGGQFQVIGVSSTVFGKPEIENCLSTIQNQIELSANLTYLRRLPVALDEEWITVIYHSLMNFGLGENTPDLSSLIGAYRNKNVDSVVFYTLTILRSHNHEQCARTQIIDFTSQNGLSGTWKLS